MTDYKQYYINRNNTNKKCCSDSISNLISCNVVLLQKKGEYLKTNNYLSEFSYTDEDREKVLKNLGINDRIGFIHLDLETGLLLIFKNESDYNLYVTDPSKYQNLITQTLDIKSGVGWVIEDYKKGKFLGFRDLESAERYQEDPKNNQNLIITQWNTGVEKGLPIYTKEMVDKLDTDPEKYILIGDETDITNSEIQDKKYNTSINGLLANILFSAIRLLLSEITKIKNTFEYGLYSYTGTNTAMSRVEYGYQQDEEEEPLWAVDEEDLSLVEEVIIGPTHPFSPIDNVNSSTDNILVFNLEGASWKDDGKISEITDSKIFIYLTSTGKKILYKFTGEKNTIDLDLSSLNIPTVDSYNILVVLSRTQTIDEIEKGSNYIWISITNVSTDETILEGYYAGGEVYPTLKTLDDKYTISNIILKELTLSKLNFYSKYQDFSSQVIPSKPTGEDYSYKVAHITIRSVSTYSILEKIKDLLPENELIFVEDTSRLYIKNNYTLKQISGGSNNPLPGNDGMTQEEIIQLLSDMGITTDELDNLLLSSDIVFVHQDTGTKFKLNIDSEGNVTTTKISDETLAEKIKKAGITIGEDKDVRGFVGRLGYTIGYNTGIYTSKKTNIKLDSDRIKIGSFYAPAITNKTFGCSHCFIELENTSDEDFPLDGCYLHLTKKVNEIPTVYHLSLKGTIPAGGTYLIRGAKKSEFNDPNTFIKVETFDQEWYENGKLLDFSHNGEVEINGTKFIGTDPHGIALTYGNIFNGDSLKYNTNLWIVNSNADNDTKTKYLYDPNYIDSVYYNSTFNDGNLAYWTTNNICMNYIADSEFKDCIYKNTFELDPANQAYQALTTYDSSRYRHQTSNDYQYLYLGKEFIEFPKSDEKYPISKFTPKASFEHKNVCTDKTQLDVEKPNMVTCSFGKNPYTTRCFNWVSGGLFDEYVFIKQGNTWIKFESYKEGDHEKESSTSFPRRKEFNNENIINCVYKRMIGRFPAANTQYTAHKCIIDILESGSVSSPTTYTYVVGRADKNGNPDVEHCSEEYTFTLYPDSYTPRIYQTTDLQGFHWVEYQVWAAAANVVNKQINEEVSNNNIIPILVNTGDMTQSGARINEWIDYYNAGKSLFKHLEQLNVVGNNDLCGNDFNILGTGDDEGKANSYYFHVFYCYEVETEEGMIPIINNKYVPSLYKVEFKNHLLLAVNSEITSINCRGWFNAISENETVNVYTGWTISSNLRYVGSFTSIYTMLYNMTNTTKEIIAICHEMPFTVITQENLADTSTIKSRWRSLSGATSLVGSHLNLLSATDKIGVNWFSRLLEYRKCKLCIGGHKHTYAVTYPLMENYIYGEKTSKVNGPMPMTDTLENDNQVSWIVNENNLSKFPLTKRVLPNTVTDIFFPSEHVDNFYIEDGEEASGVIYFMCQATGFKLMSNKELPSIYQTFSLFIPESDVKKGSASPQQRYPMYAVIELNDNIWNIELIRLENIQTTSTTLFTQINHGTDDVKKQYLYNNSNSTDAWKYGGWSDDEKILLTINV